MAVLAWEDVAQAQPVVVGPLVVSAQQLADFVELTGEAHPLHVTGGVVPAGLVHSLAAGALVQASGPMAVAGLRGMSWRFVGPVRVGAPFWVRAEVRAAEAVTDGIGTVRVARVVTGADGQVLATGTVDLALERREAKA